MYALTLSLSHSVAFARADAPTTSLKKLIARDELLADHASDAYHREAAII